LSKRGLTASKSTGSRFVSVDRRTAPRTSRESA
jgi:hypothetical protein